MSILRALRNAFNGYESNDAVIKAYENLSKVV